MDLNRNDYAHVLEDMGLWSFPRRVGSPHSTDAGTPKAFFDWWDEKWADGPPDVPMFIGHNAYEAPGPGETFDRNRMVFATAFGDLDTGDNNGCSPQDVWAEARRASQWLIDNGVSHCWKYSGSQCGFHLRVFFLPEARRRQYLEKWENAFWRGLKNELQLKSINIKCANPICLERLPYTPYVHKKDPAVKGYKRESNWCVPIPWRWIRDGDLRRIRYLSERPEMFNTVRFYAPLSTLESFVRARGWTAFGHEANALHPVPTYAPAGSMFDLNKLYIPRRLCLQTLPFGKNPRHAVRLSWLIETLNLSPPMGVEEAIAYVEAVGREAGWEDFNPRIIAQQVEQAWHRQYHRWTCKKLREEGVCVGAGCVLFRRAFPEEWGEYVRANPDALKQGATT